MEFIIEYNEYKMWSEIDYREYQSFYDKLVDNFYISEVKGIMSLFSDEFTFKWAEGYLGGHDESEILVVRHGYAICYRIHKYVDEWYVVHSVNSGNDGRYKWYKCDQFKVYIS